MALLGKPRYYRSHTGEVDLDGHILISSWHLSEITKINRQSGDVIWRLGGEYNQFNWINDEYQISYQHDIRVLPDGNYTIFDNGNFHDPHFSRAIELHLDTQNMIATKVWEFRDSPDKVSDWMGNVQRLPNGNTLINWGDGSLPRITEVRPDGSKAFEMSFVNKDPGYRVLRFPWSGMASVPYLIAEAWDDRVTLLFNKFGDQDVAYFNIYGGLAEDPGQIIATSTEPFIHLTDLVNLEHYSFRVTAINSAGQESGFSNEERVYVRLIESGQKMVINGDFSNGFDYWDLSIDTTTSIAAWGIDQSAALHINITDGGNDFSHIQAIYPNIHLIKGREYLFKFDAYAAEGRTIEADLRKMTNQTINYSRRGFTWLTPSPTSFSHQFAMTQTDDHAAMIVFSAGGSEHDIYIDNVSLQEIVSGINENSHTTPVSFLLAENFPNPFNPLTTINYNVPELSNVKITVYNIIGEKIKELIDLPHKAGSHQIRFDAINLSSGVYFYKMDARAIHSSSVFTDVKKMMVIK
jgi:hypothetical protein